MAAALHVVAALASPYQVPVVMGPLVVDPVARPQVSGEAAVPEELSTMNQQLPVPFACSARARPVPSVLTATLTADADCALPLDTAAVVNVRLGTTPYKELAITPEGVG